MIDRLYIAGMIVMTCALMLGLLWLNSAMAQTASVPAYEGCTLAWDYPADVEHHRGFALAIEGVAGNTQIAKDARSIACSAIGLTAFGPYTLRLRATATSPARNSAPVVIAIEYQPRPQLQPPTNIRVTLEWEVEP
jgi:hypothetical protein